MNGDMLEHTASLTPSQEREDADVNSQQPQVELKSVLHDGEAAAARPMFEAIGCHVTPRGKGPKAGCPED